MQTIIQGKEIETKYSVKVLRDDNGKIKSKPELVKEDKIVKWSDLFEVDGQIGSNSNTIWHSINISETESVIVQEQIYRADLNKMVAHTNKVINEIPINKTEAEIEFDKSLVEYNHTVIGNNEKMLAYCKLNNLDVDTVNIEDLKKVLGTNETGKLDNGWMYPSSTAIAKMVESVPDTIISAITYGRITSI